MKSIRGLTLVESIVSFFLITFVILSLLNLFPGAMMANRRSELRLLAQSRADQVLETARAGGFVNLKLGGAAPLEVVLEGTTFSSQLEVLEVPGHAPDSLKSLRVTVNWKAGGKPQQLVREVWMSNVRS